MQGFAFFIYMSEKFANNTLEEMTKTFDISTMNRRHKKMRKIIKHMENCRLQMCCLIDSSLYCHNYK
jgi:hypothetical protein